MKASPHAARALVLGLSTASLLMGCVAGPNYARPAAPIDLAYTAASTGDLGFAGPFDPEQHLTLRGPPAARWWVQMQSPGLAQLVDEALANNQTIAIAQANLAKAQEGIAAVQGGRLPQSDLADSVARRRYGASFLGPEGSTFPGFSAYSVGANISYDLDLSGGVKRSVEQATASADYEREQLEAVRLSVSGNTVLGVLQAASVRAQMEVVRQVLNSDEKTLSLVKAARSAGAVSDIDVLTATSQRDSDRALLPPLQQQLDAAQDALAVLTGKAPASWAALSFDLGELVLPLDLTLGVPSDLVRVRPDIRAAEAQLHAASAAVGIASADMYPHLIVSSSLAEEGIISGGTAPAWSLLGGLTAPVFHGGTLSARQRAAQDDYKSLFARYQQTVLESLQQVADTLHGLENDAAAVQTQQQAVGSADAALGLVRQGYAVGNAGIVQVLTAQRLQQIAQLGLVQARAQRHADTVRLFLAAGGGLDAGEPQ